MCLLLTIKLGVIKWHYILHILILAFFMLLAIFGRTQSKLTNEQSVFSVQTPQPSRNYVQR